MALFDAISSKFSFMAAVLLVGLLISSLGFTGVQSIGVCYGRNGNNIPSAADVINLYKANNIGAMRLYDPFQDALQALKGSNIELILDVPNDKLQNIASDASAAAQWVQTNVVSYAADVKFKYITVGNEVQPSSATAQYVLPAMQKVRDALASAGLQDQIKVSTAVDTGVLGTSYPPSSGAFNGAASSYLSPIISFLASNGAPLLANVYPYFSRANNQQDISLPYALFTSPGVVVTDGNLGYQNLFDAILDALYSALEKTGGAQVEIVVSESGWPSEGGVDATADNAATYYRKFIEHVKGGTPKRPTGGIKAYLFALFDENGKGGAETEKHFGLFNPTNKQPKYQISFT